MIHSHQKVKTLKEDILTTGKIKFISINVNDPNHVGQDHQWDYEVLINNVYVSINQELTIDIQNDKIQFLITVREKDIVDDIGSASRICSYQASKGKPLFINVEVEENKGKYTGNKAIVSFWFEVK